MSAAGWFSLATAVGTLALALATFSMASKTADAAETSRDLLKIERDQLRQGYLPVVVPAIDELRVGVTPPVAERGENSLIITNPNTTTVLIPVQNIGVGPALGVEVDLYWLDQNGDESVAGQPLRFPTRFGGLPPAGTREVAAQFAGLAANPPLPFLLSIEFFDSAGARYITQGRYFPAEERFREMSLSAFDEKDELVRVQSI